MSLQTSGAISLSNLQTEFGGSNPIGLNEYYRNGSYVPSTVVETATISNFSYTESYSARYNYGGYSNFWRYYEAGSGYPPRTNQTGNYLFSYYHWTDQAWTHYEDNWVDSTMTIDKAGSYVIAMGGYNTGASRSSQIYLNGSLIASVGLNQSHTFTANAGDTFRVVSHMNTIGNYNGLAMTLTTAYGNTTLNTSTNGRIPTAGALSLANFYGSASQGFVGALSGDGSVYVSAVGGTSGASGPDIYYSGQPAKTFRLRRSGNSFFLDWTYNELDYANQGAGSLDVTSVFPLDGNGNLDTNNTNTYVQNNVVASYGRDVRQIGAGSKVIGDVRYWWFGTDAKNFGGIRSDVTVYDAYVDVGLTLNNDATDAITVGQ